MNKIIALLLFAFLLSCNNNEKKQQISFAPKITEAKGYLVPKDSVSEPKTIPAGIPTTVKAGAPKVNPTNLNVHIAGQPKIIVAGLPKINTPGTDTLLLPKTILTIGITKPAGIPEVVIAKDAAAKDVNPANFSFYKTLQGLKHNNIRCMLQDKTGNLWFGTYGGVCRYDGKSFTNFTEKEGLSNNFVLSILEDKTGNLWFGTNGGGVCRYDGKSFTNFTEKEGLSNNAVLNMMQDVEGNIWFGTRKGLSKVTPMQLAKVAEKNDSYNPIKEAFFYNYGYNDGFLGLNCRRNSVLQDSKGRIWWGTDVLTCYDPKGNIADTTAPLVNLTSVKLFGEEIAWANLNAVYTDSTGKEIIKGKTNDTLLSNGILLKDIKFDGLTKWFNLPEHLSLPYNNNNLTFNFIGVHMQSRNHIKYQYKLEGIDPDWSSITNRTEAPYGNLPSGDYVFKIKAMNQSGVWSEPFEYKFIVRPPWWQTWWFRVLVGLIIIGSIFYFIKSREKKLVAEKEKLEKTVEQRTEELVQKNIVVEQQKHLVEEKHKEITDSINYAERIQRALLASKKMLDENLADYFI